jgi:hypothetical protein|tara:strand:+ start:261 stop:503 length:243 start_codon:yes stop_codon:yes gene_type:complete
MIRLYFIGIAVLITAVLATLFAEKIQCKTWYDFLKGLSSSSDYWNVLTFKDLLWLFLIYPLLLGLGSFIGDLIYQKMFSL